MSQTSQCDTRSPPRCALLTSIKPSMSCTLETAPMHMTEMFTAQFTLIDVLSLCGPPQKPSPTPQQSRGGCSTCQHCPTSTMRPGSFPSLLSACRGSCWQRCESPEGFLCPLLRGGCPGAVNPGRDTPCLTVPDFVLCAFASLPACSRARCFSLLE